MHNFLKNSTVGKFAHIGQSELVGIIGLKLQRSRSHFLSGVFAAVAEVHENVTKKQTSHHFKLFRDDPNSACYLKEGDFG